MWGHRPITCYSAVGDHVLFTASLMPNIHLLCIIGFHIANFCYCVSFSLHLTILVSTVFQEQTYQHVIRWLRLLYVHILGRHTSFKTLLHDNGLDADKYE